jgi:SAM-dependent methyltransferase
MDQAINEAAVAQLSAAIGQWDQGATCLAALAVTADAAATTPLGAAARDVLTAAGLDEGLHAQLPFTPLQLHGMVASPLLLAAALVDGPGAGWDQQSDSTLAAQGHASGSAAILFARFVLPHFPDLAERLAQPGARMLDVGTGIGALAVGYALTFPRLHVTGIDVMPRVLELARSYVGASPVAPRVALRQQDVTELTDHASYDISWIPAPFLPAAALTAGVARTVVALKPGGLLILGHGTLDGTDLQNAITRFKTTAYGGTTLDGPSARDLLSEHNLTAVQTVPTPPGAPSLTVGRR